MGTQFVDNLPSPTQRTMLTEKELSARIGISVRVLQSWRVRRNAGEDIGPKFVKISGPAAGRNASGRRPVRYMIKHVEEWEQSLIAQTESAA